MIIHDISLTLTEGMLTYPKDVRYRRTLQRDLSAGDSSNVSVLEMSAHTGTHVDAPRHYYQDGYGADEIPLSHLFGPVFVADCRGAAAVTAELLARIMPAHTKRLLLKTDNSQILTTPKGTDFRQEYVYLNADGAAFLTGRGVLLVGIDYLTVDGFGLPDKPAHHSLLGKNVVILEGIDLSAVEQGEYFLACAPLKLADSDGAPARAVLMEGLAD